MVKLLLVIHDPSSITVSIVKTLGQLLSPNTFAEILTHLCHVPLTQTPVCQQPLAFNCTGPELW